MAAAFGTMAFSVRNTFLQFMEDDDDNSAVTPVARRPRSKTGPASFFTEAFLETVLGDAPEVTEASVDQQASDEACPTSETDIDEPDFPINLDKTLFEDLPTREPSDEFSDQSARLQELPRLLGSRWGPGPVSAKLDRGLTTKISVRNTFVHFSDDSDDEGIERRARTIRTVPARLLSAALLQDEEDSELGGEELDAPRKVQSSPEVLPPSLRSPRQQPLQRQEQQAQQQQQEQQQQPSLATAPEAVRPGNAGEVQHAPAAAPAAGGPAPTPGERSHVLDASPKAMAATPEPMYVERARSGLPTAASEAAGVGPKAEDSCGPRLRLCIRNTFLHVADEAEAAEPMPGPHGRAPRRSKTGPAKLAFFDDLSDDGSEDEGATAEAAGRPGSDGSEDDGATAEAAGGPCGPAPAQEPRESAGAVPPQALALQQLVAAAVGPPGARMPVPLPPGAVLPPVSGFNLVAASALAAQLSALQAARSCGDPAPAPQPGQVLEVKTAAASTRASASSSKRRCQDTRTTVVLKNLPLNYRRAMLLRMLDSEGFAAEYNYVYLPMDFKTKAGFGYAFINLVDASVVPHFWQAFDGYTKWSIPSAKVCQVSWSVPHQGLKDHIRRYRNSPLMHASVPDEYKPALFSAGIQVAFPPPTKAIAAPGQRTRPAKGGRQQPSA